MKRDPAAPDTNTDRFRQELTANLRLDFFDEQEISEILAAIDVFDRRVWQKVLALCLTLSQASSSLVPSSLERIRKASRILSLKDLDQWLSHAYDLLDHQGIGRFIDFISRIDDADLQRFRTPRGLSLSEVLPLLETFMRGISGLELRIAAGLEHYTDTAIIYLPHSIDRYEERPRNLLIYKLMIAEAWAQLDGGTLVPGEKLLTHFMHGSEIAHPDISDMFGQFDHQELAIDIYTIIEAARLTPFLKRELPGLMLSRAAIIEDLLAERPAPGALAGSTAFVEGLYQAYLRGEKDSTFRGIVTWQQGLEMLERLYARAAGLEGDYHSIRMPFLPKVRPSAVSLQLKAARRARKQKIDAMITRLMTPPEFDVRERTFGKGAREEQRTEPEKEYLLIKGRMIELDSELRETIEERGGVPGGILVKGADMGAPASPMNLTDLIEEAETAIDVDSGIAYDEWDFRRGDYKKKWCMLHEKNVHPGHEPFVENTLRRHSGTVSILRKNFELLRKEPKLVRRQMDGDDIDIDAVVEAFSDIRAGLSPGERLFTKYDRQDRNIAALFLLDMSGSTKGWVIEAEKESLVLMAEALEALGDSYGIYGFSGMTRNRCDFYRIKDFDEPYAEAVRRRISGIEPKDYTRMGPPMRHSITLLNRVKARTKLLITLSDGRPEDYDAYKGDYGIEDTRKALVEAKEQGIHSFCITIDREASSYLRHMYGEVNYIVIDDVKKLPHRITEIYRRLTT